nr:CBM_HP1_G0009490.mRNA.1.CDS.1 [Saccharomyces cerevisiae]
MATVHEIIMWEKKNKTKFVTWLKEIDNSVEITRSKMYHDVIFFGGFFKSLQNMPVTLRSILKNTDPSMEDYEYLKILNFEVNQVHGLAIDHRKLVRFSKQLVLSTNSNATSYVNVGGSTKRK